MRKRKDVTWEVDKNGCWNCTSHNRKSGRPHITINYKTITLSRYIYEQHKSKIPEGLFVRHTCDNGECINPNHLILGTHKDNMKDMVDRKRSMIGKRNKHCILTEEQVQEIRQRSENNCILSKEYGVHHSTISAIRLRKIWKHI